MPSLDIVSEVDNAEILNATQNAARELTTRFDFRGVDASITFANEVVTLKAEADFQCQQLLDIFATQLVKRKIDPTVIEYDDEALHSGKIFSLNVTFKQGIAADVAKKIVKLITINNIFVSKKLFNIYYTLYFFNIRETNNLHSQVKEYPIPLLMFYKYNH